MSNGADTTLKWETLERFRKAKEDFLALENRMANIGKVWADFAAAIQRPGDFSFRLGREEIVFAQRSAAAPVAFSHISRSDVDWDSLSKLIADYQATSQEKNELAARLRKAGVAT